MTAHSHCNSCNPRVSYLGEYGIIRLSVCRAIKESVWALVFHIELLPVLLGIFSFSSTVDTFAESQTTPIFQPN
jgi:hypothetical protein